MRVQECLGRPRKISSLRDQGWLQGWTGDARPRLAASPMSRVQVREIFELFVKLPVPQRKLARGLIIAMARANGMLPLARSG